MLLSKSKDSRPILCDQWSSLRFFHFLGMIVLGYGSTFKLLGTVVNDPKKHYPVLFLFPQMASMHGHQKISEKAPHFFKFLLHDNIQRGNLMIPQSFTRKHGKDISDTVLLKVPSGAEWPVKLTKCDTGVWSLHGLQDFMDYYSLQLGYFLLFRYQGKFNFWVVICDTSASEIEYPVHDTNTCVQQGMFSGEPSQVSEVGRTQSNSEEKHKIKSCSYETFEDTEEGEELMACGQKWLKHDISGPLSASKKSRALKMVSSFKSKNPFFVVFMRPTYVCNRFRLVLPMSFANKYFLKDHGYLNLHCSNSGPWCVEFIRYNSRANENRTVVFTVGWKAFAQDNKLRVGDVCVFELNKGTESILQKKKGTESSLQVVIYRSSEDAHSHDFKRMKVPKMEDTSDDDVSVQVLGKTSCLRPQRMSTICLVTRSNGVKLEKPKRKSGSSFQQDLEGQGKKQRMSGIPRDLQMTTSLAKPESPFFMITMQPSYVIRGLRPQIPRAFVQEHFPSKDHGDILLWDSNGRAWPVKYISRTPLYYSPKIEFTYGWKEFMQEHDLEVDDFCVFELIDSKKFSLKVTIVRGNQCAEGNLIERKKVISKVSEVGRTQSNGVYAEKHKHKSCSYNGFEDKEGEGLMGRASKKSRALQMAYSFKSKNPFFLVLMQPSYVCNTFRLNLPMCFITKYLLKDHGYLNLHSSNGGPWRVKYIRYKSRANNRRKVEFTAGWKAFAQDNELGIGDVCVFELKKGRESLLQVVIYRSCKDADSHDFKRMKVPKMEDTSYDDDVSVQVLDDFSPGGKILGCFLPWKKGEKTSSSMYGSRDNSGRVTHKAEMGEHRSEYPFFRITMTSNYLHNSLTVPKSFVRKYIKERSCNMELQFADKSWVVKSRIYEDGSCKIFKFSAFARENRLREGDVCIFELIKSKDMLFNVSVVRHIG